MASRPESLGQPFTGRTALPSPFDGKGGILQVHAIHEDVPFDRTTRSGVRAEVKALGAWLGLEIAGL